MYISINSQHTKSMLKDCPTYSVWFKAIIGTLTISMTHAKWKSENGTGRWKLVWTSVQHVLRWQVKCREEGFAYECLSLCGLLSYREGLPAWWRIFVGIMNWELGKDEEEWWLGHWQIGSNHNRRDATSDLRCIVLLHRNTRTTSLQQWNE